MKRIKFLSIAVLSVMFATAAFGQAKGPQGMPPLIDRELLFGNPEISGAQISPDGKYIAFLKPWNDTRNVWVKKREEPFSAARLLTAEKKRPIGGYLWSRDGKYVLFVKDNDGDENFNVFAVDPAAATATAGAEGTAPAPKDLTGVKGVQVQLYSAPKNDPDTLYIGLNDRDKAWHDLYKVQLSTGQKTLLRKNTDRIASWFFDQGGVLKLAARTTDAGDTEILRVDPDKFTQVYSCGIFDGCGPVRYHADGKRVYMETNKTTDLAELVLFDPATMKLEKVESDPLNRVDFGSAAFSDLTDEITMTSYEDDRVRRYFKSKTLEADYKWLQGKLPGLEVGMGSHTRDEQFWLVGASGDTEPGSTYLYDRKGKTLTLQYKVREKIARESLATIKPIRYKSSDGLEISAYLTLPKGVPAKNLPTIVFPHGGPWARDSWGFNGYWQFLANRGYAVLAPNFRGSTGYGKKFLNAGNGEWGKKMQDDITWGVKHLIQEGTTDAKRVGIMGGSYGGYATLAGVAFTPDVYRAAVDIVGPSNLTTLLEAIPPYWEAGKKMMFARMGDPGTEAGKTWLRERSPLYSADKIKTPLLVVQGANDPRVNRAEAEQIVIALRDRKFPVEYILAPDEGHGFQRPVNNMAMMMAVEKFFALQLDGRYQEGGKPEVVSRLKEIMVDPASVKLAPKVDTSKATSAQPVRELVQGELRFAGSIAMGPQSINLKTTSKIVDAGPAWACTDSIESPMGAMSASATMLKSSLRVTGWTVNQGPIAMNFTAGPDNKVTGALKMNGNEKPVQAELGGPLFAEGACQPQSVAALPLAVGYSTTFRNFDMQKMKVKLMQLTVTGTEQVTVPAGSFDAFKVEIVSAEGASGKMTVWVDKAKNVPVKVSSQIPELNGAVLTLEQQP